MHESICSNDLTLMGDYIKILSFLDYQFDKIMANVLWSELEKLNRVYLMCAVILVKSRYLMDI